MTGGKSGFIPTPARLVQLLNDRADSLLGYHDFKDCPAYRTSPPRVATPFLSVRKFLPKAFETEAQVGPDCTSHALRNAINISRAVEIDVHQESEDFVGELSTEIFYSYRGHTGAGMNPGRAISFATKYGALLRKSYPFGDFSRYSRQSLGWAVSLGRAGPPLEALREASKHPCKYYLRIKTVEELRRAIANGYGVIHGSKYGTDSRRGEKGRAKWTKTWNHAMAFGGYEDEWYLTLNSWGVWNSGPHPDFGPIPGGSFMMSERDIKKTWTQGAETWAIGNFEGFPIQRLPTYNTSAWL